MMKEKKIFRHLTSKDIYLIYELLVRGGFVSFPITPDAEAKVDSLVSNISSKYFGYEIYKTPEEKSLAYMYFIIKDHPFVDGNKRTASLVFEVLCDLNNLKPDYSLASLDTLAVFIEKTQEADYHRVIRVISKILFKTPKSRLI